MPAKRHRHEFHALWSHFGPYSTRGDVHWHPCIAGPEDKQNDCDRVLIGEGRDCVKGAKHWRETLNA